MNVSVKKLVENIKLQILKEIKEFLENETPPIDLHEFLHDTIHEVLDTEVATYSDEQCLQIIKELENEEYIDSAILPPLKEGISAILAAIAYESIYIELFNDDLINSLQKTIEDHKELEKILNEIDKTLYGVAIVKPKIDTQHQLLDFEPFTMPLTICDERKIIKLHNAIKVFSQKARHGDINYNALVFEGKQITPKVLRVERIYVMGHPKETDLRAIKHKLTHPNRQFLYRW